jgi:hypothetical protein
MTDEKDDSIDAALIEASRGYNAPASLPREEMWLRIQAARKARTSTIAPRRRWIWPSAAVAAAVVLAAGIGIGRRWERTNSHAPVTVATNTPAFVAPAVPTDADASASLSYKLVVFKHLASSEALITAFRSAAERGEIDQQLRDWSKEMLSTTRMLEASGSTSDPTLRRLLSDLDLVLTQIKQYAARGTKDLNDLDLIEESINKRGVMTKLRSTLPARALPAGI